MEILVKKEKIEAVEDEKILGFIDFKLENNVLTIYRTMVFKEARGKGVAKQLNDYIFDYLNKGVKEIKVVCSYSKEYFLKNKSKYNDAKVVFINEENNACTL